MADAGLFRLALPRTLGGFEMDLPSYIQVIEEIGRADASTGWVTNQVCDLRDLRGADAHRGGARHLDRHPARGGRQYPAAPTRRPSWCPGGYRVTGRQGFSTGCRHASWLAAHATVSEQGRPRLDDGQPETRYCFVPRAQAELLDTWQVRGMRGTGTNHFAVNDVFVPEDRTVKSVTAPLIEQGPLYRLPRTLVFASGDAAVALGTARSCLDAFTELATTKTPRAMDALLRDQPMIQSEVGRAEARLRSGLAFLREAVREIWGAVVANGAVTLEQRAVLRLATTDGIRTAASVVDMRLQHGGRHRGLRVEPDPASLPGRPRDEPAPPGPVGPLRAGGSPLARPQDRRDAALGASRRRRNGGHCSPTRRHRHLTPRLSARSRSPRARGPAALLAERGAARRAWAQETPKKGGTLRVGFYIEAATMDPHLSGSKIDRQVYHNIYEPLVVLDANLGIKPGLAESWQQPDPKTLIFKLRRGVKFHDGTDFNAEAVKFNFNRMKTEPKSVRKGEVASIDTVDVVDAYTVKLNLKRPDAALLATLTDRAGMMVSPKTAQERGAELERNAKGAGTGPFVFVEWVKDDHLLIRRNDSYWNKQGGPYLEQIRYRPIPDDTVKLQSLQAGEIQVMDYVQPRDVAAVKADKNVVVLDVPSLADFAYQLNHTKPPFDNKALRQAVAYALDLEQIVKGVWLNVGVPANGPIPPTSWAYDRLDRHQARPRQGQGEARRGRQAGRLHVHDTTNNIPINVQEAEVIQAQLAEAGITMKIKLVDAGTLISDGNGKNFEMITLPVERAARIRTATPTSSTRPRPARR